MGAPLWGYGQAIGRLGAPPALSKGMTMKFSSYLRHDDGLVEQAAESHTRLPGGESRWNAGKDLTWQPLRPELVVEVAYDHMQGTRFRHTARFRNWRPDRDPASCTYAQLEVPATYSLDDIFES